MLVRPRVQLKYGFVAPRTNRPLCRTPQPNYTPVSCVAGRAQRGGATEVKLGLPVVPLTLACRYRAGSVRRDAVAAMAAAAAPSGRLPCAAHLGLARRNSLRALRALRSDRRRENEVGRALRALQPKAALLGAADIAAPAPRLPLRAAWVQFGRNARHLPRLPVARMHTCRTVGRARSSWQSTTVSAKARAGSLRRVRVRSREAQGRWPARAARLVPHSRGACPSGARVAREASCAARPATRASQGTPAQQGQALARVEGSRLAPLRARTNAQRTFHASRDARSAVEQLT